ncbi:tetratricopeptide repeat protein [Schaalia odontolytica]|uniref:tetratricopeptide repeat protein n=2 Tax=Schaalia odontolytica TaxID=1660 RepID=UPI00140220A8|nr:tetratricopeptide repeat protein [Schaalia odontolytica]WMS27303.1 tetratricopeptide repeat protein [Schaalia odontolytica]
MDLCVAFCCAALDAGIYPLILTVTADGGQRRHAIVLVPMERQWAMGCDVLIDEGFSREPMLPNREDLRDLVVGSADDPGGTWLAIDVQQVTESDGNWKTALFLGAEYVHDWEWDVCVDVGGLRSRTPDCVLPPGGHIEKVLAPAYAELPENFTPLQLMWGRYGAVPYQQCDEIRQLREWATTTADATAPSQGGHNADIAVAVVTGTGGSGKTRLAAQLCHELSSIGWYAGFLPSTVDVTDEELSALTEVTTELLVVVDYAEEARRGLVARVVRKLRARHSPTRIVLTARGADAWWEEFREEAEQEGTPLSNTLSMSIRGKQQVEADPWFFGRMYRRAVQQFSDKLNKAVPTDVEVPEGLGDTALDVVLRAWLAVCDNDEVAKNDIPTREELYDRVLSIEFARWRKEPKLEGISRDHLRRAAATLSLLAPKRDTDEIDDVLSRLPEWNQDHLLRNRLAELVVQSLLRDDGANSVSLRPDPVAEHLILDVFGKNPELLDRVVPQDPAQLPGLDDSDAEDSVVTRALEMGQQARNACVTITRASSLDREVALRLARRALRERPFLWKEALDVALIQGGPLAPALEALIESGATLPLGVIDDAIPVGHPALAGAALAATMRLANSAERSPEQQAHWANNLSIRLSDIGERKAALEAAREAVELYRGLAEASPAAYAPDLAGSLNNLANCLSAVGERNEALEAAREAVELYRGLAEASPAAYAPDLAGSLNNLAACLSAVGERNEALEAAREAVRLRRALAEASPAAYAPALAGSLTNLAAFLSAVGERNEALEAAREAVRLRRALAEASPAAYAPDLAMSLTNLAAFLSEVGKQDEALEAAREAVRLRRALAEASPQAYAPDLAMSLNNLAAFLSEVGKQDEALEAAREAVELYRGLAEATPAAYAPDLAMSLTNLANLLSAVGERNEALEAAREAVRLRRALAEASPQAYTPDLAMSLTNLANLLSEVGKQDEALEAAREAVRLRRALAEASPQAYTPDLAMSLNNLANILSAVGERNEALEAAREAVRLRRALAEASPQAYAPALAMSLNNLANRLSEVGERNEALEAARKAVELYRGLAEATPQTYTPKLAGSLTNLANCLSEVGERNEALVAAREAVRLRRALAEASPQAYAPDLAMSLNNLANRLSEVGERNEALEAAREAVELYRGLAEATPAAYAPDLAMSLTNLANLLSAVGERNEALEAAREAVRLRRALAEATPAAYTPDLAASLNNLAAFLSAVGKQDEALEAAREAVRLRRALAEASPAAYAPALAGSLTNLAAFLSAVGKQDEALEAAREAVRLRRALAEASPAAYAPDLAMSLTNLAAFLSEVGKQDEALEAAREAVRLRRALAEASPQAYTPNLAMSLTNLANILSAVGERNEALETFVEGFDCFSPAVRARLLVARATWRDDGGEAGDVVAAAREADSTDDPVLLGPVRRMIARVITDAGIMGTGLPRWVTVDAESATSRIKGWLECSDLAQRVAFLEVQWSSPSASEKETLAALAELNVDRPSVAELAALVERIADSGIQAVTTDLRTHHRAQLLARDWYEAHLNGRGASFLREHMRGNPDASRGEGQISEGGKQEPEEREKDLGDPDMRIRVLQVLAATLPEDEVAIMDAIIELAQLADQSTAYDAQRSDEGAEDTLREFLEARNWRAMILVLGLRPSVAESTYGRIARLLSEAVTDEPVQRLRELYEHANEEMDAIHRRQLQALLDKALRTDQCTPAFADILSWTRNSGSRQQ